MNYQPTGTPLTERERELLTILVEECNEVSLECSRLSIAASKVLRFGKNDQNPDTLALNTVSLGLELGDMVATGMLVIDSGVIEMRHVIAGIKRKGEKLGRYLQKWGAPP
jgi:hypothetical protein